MKKLIISFAFFLIVQYSFNIKNCDAQWVQMSNGISGEIVYSLAVNGNNIFAGTDWFGVYLSTNSSESWTQIGLNNKVVRSLVSLGNYIFAGLYWGGGVCFSTNNGTNWTQTVLSTETILSFATLGNNILTASEASSPNSGHVFLSTNYGTNWTQTSLNNKSVYSFAVSGNNIFAGTVNYPTGGSGVYLSTDNGANWTQTSLNNKPVYSLAISGNNLFAGTYGSGVYYSTNKGANWTQIGLNINRAILSITISGSNIFAGTMDSGVYLSTNNGTNWIQINQGFNVIPFVYTLLIANNYIFAGTNGESLWRRPLSDFTGIQNISTEIPLNFKLEQNYPNPFNPTTTIKFDIAKTEKIKLIIFDALGRVVETLVNEQLQPGSYSVDWNASEYTSGVYFYRLQTDSYTETKRMAVVK